MASSMRISGALRLVLILCLFTPLLTLADPPSQIAERAPFNLAEWEVVLTDTSSQIAQSTLPSVVLLVMEDSQGKTISQGSGFVVRDGIIATNRHVIDGAARGYARKVGEEARYNIRGIVASDVPRDLVMLSVEGLSAKPLPIGDSSKLAVGDTVYAVGNPRGMEGTFSNGIISSIRKLTDQTLLQITAPISPGSSGGPLVNSKGEVVGVVVATLAEAQNRNFAVSSEYLHKMLAQLTKPQPLSGSAKPMEDQSPKISDQRWQELAKIFRQNAEAGNASAMFNLGVMYAKGEGVVQDHREAVQWYRKAAEAGDAEAMFYLGVRYFEGQGVVQDHREAVQWFRKAAEAGNASAMNNLGAMYRMGEGVVQDFAQSYVWFSLAAAFGYQEAPKARDEAAKRLTPEVKLAAQERARQLHQAISEQAQKSE